MKYGKWLSLLLLCGVFAAPLTLSAQSDAWKVVVLDVPGGGTDKLKSELSKGIPINIESQNWFITQVQNRGFRVQKIMRRPGDLKWVLNGANIDYVIYLAPLNENQYEARVVEKATAKPAFKFKVPRSGEGLNNEIASQVARKIKKEWGYDVEELETAKKQQTTPDPPEKDKKPRKEKKTKTDKKPEPPEKERPPKPKAPEKSDQKEPSTPQKIDDEEQSQPQLQKVATGPLTALYEFELTGQFPKRDLLVGSFPAGGYFFETSSYPGVGLQIFAFPFAENSQGSLSKLGFYFDGLYGSKSYSFVDDNGNEQSLAMANMELELGLSGRFGNTSPNTPNLRVKLGGRHRSFSSTNQDFLPSMSHNAVVLGTDFSVPLFSRTALVGGASFAPLVFHSKGVDRFGESASSVEFSGQAGADVRVTDSIGITAGYRFNSVRTEYSKDGNDPAINFSESDGFDLVHGPFVGLQYRLSP